MPEIVVTVKNKMAVGDGSVIVCNNSDYVVRFALDSEWDALALRTMRIVYDSYSHTDIAFSGDTVGVDGDKISKIHFTNTQLPVGTIIKIYGVSA